jgi:hypothetical protein
MTQHKTTHIRNVYMTGVRRTPHIMERVLVIETDLRLPQSRFAPRDPRIDDLLLELSDLKQKNPTIFRSVDTVEIRDAQDHMNGEADDDYNERSCFPMVAGERVPPARAAHLPTV